MKRSLKKNTENKKIINAQKKEYNGIKFRSKLEVFIYQKLLEAGIKDFQYEEHTFILQDKFEYPNESYELYDQKEGNRVKHSFINVTGKIRAMTYTPDFVHINEDKTGWIIESKGFAQDSFKLKWKLFKKYLIDNGYNISLYKPNTQGNTLKCIEMIKNKYYA